jgi:low affinity Fe/Cu permease
MLCQKEHHKVIVIKASDPKEIQKMVEELAKIKCRKDGIITISGGGTVIK